ncbi:MAG: YbhB/YbcL family Raf kinase inhibitor-like protein [Dermatophilaceae bacterium]
MAVVHRVEDGFPDATKSFVITVFDADAPTGSGFWHWAVHGIPAAITSLPTGAGTPDAALLPEGAVQLRGDAGVAGYVGAAPPPGTGAHRLFVAVTALDVDALQLPDGSSPALLHAMSARHVCGRATLVALAER